MPRWWHSDPQPAASARPPAHAHDLSRPLTHGYQMWGSRHASSRDPKHPRSSFIQSAWRCTVRSAQGVEFVHSFIPGGAPRSTLKPAPLFALPQPLRPFPPSSRRPQQRPCPSRRSGAAISLTPAVRRAGAGNILHGPCGATSVERTSRALLEGQRPRRRLHALSLAVRKPHRSSPRRPGWHDDRHEPLPSLEVVGTCAGQQSSPRVHEFIAIITSRAAPA